MAVDRNSEILYLYDARLCNPNGDPDEENKPRMDYDTGRNLVSDVRLKRYLRDYWLSLDEDYWSKLGFRPQEVQDVWIRKIDRNGEESTVTAKERIDQLTEELVGKKAKNAFKDQPMEVKKKLLEKLIDVRLFGATIPIGGESGRGGSQSFTGPVQFTWGYSLNKVEILPSSTITSHFAGQEGGEKGEYGTMGKDWRVKYSFLAFYGIVSAWRSRYTELTPNDVNVLDYSMLSALPLMATTRSKIGQTPRLYMRVEYQDGKTFLGDLRNLIDVENPYGWDSIKDVNLHFDRMIEKLLSCKEKISRVIFWSHDDFSSGKQLLDELRKELEVEVKQP